MAQSSSMKVIEESLVSPPSGFIPETPLSLTFFDIKWLSLPPVSSINFYSYPHETTHFMKTTLADIKHSLSITLQPFYPLAGKLTWPLDSTKPVIDCSEHNLSVTLAVVESNVDFNHLVGDHPRDVNDFYPLVPQLTSSDTTRFNFVPVMAVQVTVFPNAGISIGTTTMHTVADGSTFGHFMRSWASVCKAGGDLSSLGPESLPVIDRSLIKDPKNFDDIYLNALAGRNVSQKCFYTPKTPTVKIDMVRSTFSLGRKHIEKIKSGVLAWFDAKENATTTPVQVSTFVATCAYLWVCLTKVLAANEDVDEKAIECFMFPVDYRERWNPPVAKTYFGNCVMPCFVDVKSKDLLGEHGVSIAAEAIRNAILKMHEVALIWAENLFTKMRSMPGRVFAISGSPKMALYGTDFGWGAPKKYEAVSIDNTGTMSLCECPSGEGVVEIGIVLNKVQMDAFAFVFADTVSVLP
uniref:Putative anthocyanin acyltransferase n=1 Tax=Epimedium sagittatum TaxID=253616 RepID=A0A0A7DN21_9MAGN|nr:putative anthocyanin acyltransferase [Epimedium sagittatum]